MAEDALVRAGAPFARVAVDVPLPHLDRLFDYRIPEELDGQARPGVRVRVRFSGRLVDGYLIDRAETSDAPGRLSPLSRVVSPEPVLLPEQVRLIRAVADHYGGVFADVVRLAVPPRHATTEKAEQRVWPAPERTDLPAHGLADYPHGSDFLAHLGEGGSPRAFWQVAPAAPTGDPGLGDWAGGLRQAAAATLASGRGVIAVVPDARDLERLRARFAEWFGSGALAVLHSDLGPAARYRNYLALARGQARVLIGTRSAIFAPMRDLGLVMIMDDGDDLLVDPHAPYPHARDVAAIRASQQGAGLLFAAHGRTAEVAAWVERGWLAPIELTGAQTRHAAPAVRVSGDSDQALERDPLARAARLPRLAFETIRTGLAAGPVLVQVPRAGYLVALSCQRCRTPVRCPNCSGPVRLTVGPGGARTLACGWCARVLPGFRCANCGGTELRAPVVGSGRTAEELGRAFPGYRLIDSSGDRVVDTVGDQPAVVVATPGAEPVAACGYSAAVLLDAGLLLSRQDLRASEEALRRWLNAMALVRGGAAGGSVCLVGPSQDRTVQALVRVDPGGLASRELAERREAGFPPASCLVTVEGAAGAVAEFAAALHRPADAMALGPVEVGTTPDPAAEGGRAALWRLTLRTPGPHRQPLVDAVKGAVGVRSARKDTGALRVRVDG